MSRDNSVQGEERYFFSYAVTITSAVDYDECEINFLELKGLSEDEYNALDENARNKINIECDEHNIGKLKEALEEQGFKVYKNFRNESAGLGLLFLGENSLPAFDHIFRAISESMYIEVLDLTTMTRQSYSDGEYDTGSLSDEPEDYIENVKCLLDELKKDKVVPEKPNLDQIPVWQILGDCALRFKNDLMPVKGIEMSFRELLQDDNGDDDVNHVSYTFEVSFNKRQVSCYIWLASCQSSPRIDWDNASDCYNQYIDDALESSAPGTSLEKFEDHVRQLFKKSCKKPSKG